MVKVGRHALVEQPEVYNNLGLCTESLIFMILRPIKDYLQQLV